MKYRVIRCADTGEWVPSYEFYLQTEHWRHLRNVKRLLGDCEHCGYPITHEFDIHHLHYNTLGAESPSDLMLLHPACHKLLHGIAIPRRARNLGSTPVSVFMEALRSRIGAR
jgi:5-methylcytosine-specific restriction endonuclease McrA